MIVLAQSELFKDYRPVTLKERCYRPAFTPEPREIRKLMSVRKVIRTEVGKILIKFKLI